ncbi:MAG: DNA polymerase III subunit gamma/tau [Oligoflexia bacterium]|nr:DNA polymerase III subunit gamma/tau [Oligoflexia bacterium]
MNLDSSSYIVLARKWRPAQFSDIVGQSHIVRTLMNAVRAQRIHQAYLFTGSRGIGKTSIARIFAKVIRCEHTQLTPNTNAASVAAGAPAEWLHSCDQCANCKEIAAGTSVDVLEIDGASNNGVEAVREIRENAKYLPASGSRKIYIIDEVHMLTTAAFNALLKTLEEPPAHVIFIFATTEPHKIPATILSRCQRFDYRRVTIAQIQNRLTEVTAAEKIKTDPGALAVIARAAEGSMRDALSLLDQVIAFAGSHITVQSVRDSVGLVEGQTLLGILAGIFERKPKKSLEFVDQAYQRGHDLKVLGRGLIEFLHAAILSKVGAENSGALEISAEEWAELQTIAALRPLEEIEMIFQVFHQGLEWIAHSPQPKIVLDILVVKCAAAEGLAFASAAQAAPTASTVPTAAATPIPAKPAINTSSVPAVTKPVNTPAPAPKTSTGPVSSAGSWEGLIESIRTSRPLLASILENGICIQLPGEGSGADADALIIGFQAKDNYFKEQLQARSYQEQLTALAKDYFGRHTRILFEVREGESLADRKQREIASKQKLARDNARNHPTIVEAKALFGGELGPIDIEEDNNG